MAELATNPLSGEVSDSDARLPSSLKTRRQRETGRERARERERERESEKDCKILVLPLLPEPIG